MDQKKIGAFLREHRKKKELTQEMLAEMLGVSNRHGQQVGDGGFT